MSLTCSVTGRLWGLHLPIPCIFFTSAAVCGSTLQPKWHKATFTAGAPSFFGYCYRKKSSCFSPSKRLNAHAVWQFSSQNMIQIPLDSLGMYDLNSLSSGSVRWRSFCQVFFPNYTFPIWQLSLPDFTNTAKSNLDIFSYVYIKNS